MLSGILKTDSVLSVGWGKKRGKVRSKGWREALWAVGRGCRGGIAVY